MKNVRSIISNIRNNITAFIETKPAAPDVAVDSEFIVGGNGSVGDLSILWKVHRSMINKCIFEKHCYKAVIDFISQALI